jgi:hypothetical protein
MFDQARIIRVVIASPGDLEAERNSIPNLFVRWNRANKGFHLTPVMWETGTVPTYGDHPQHIINEQLIDSSDLLVALFWKKIGSPTPSAKSGTIEEIREFLRLKGPKRVMVYFCTRAVDQSPDDIDPTALILLKEFKAEMRSKCLYQEFKDTSEFEKHLYYHLDLKTDELLRGLLDNPRLAEAEVAWWSESAADARLRQPIDFGSTIGEVAQRFSQQMDNFDAEGGATNNRFFDLGVHAYRSIAKSIEDVLRSQPYDIDLRIRPELADSVAQLRRLAATDFSSYLKYPLEFWTQGRIISNSVNSAVEGNSADRILSIPARTSASPDAKELGYDQYNETETGVRLAILRFQSAIPEIIQEYSSGE